MIGEKGLGWELQWHRTGGESFRFVLSRPMVRGLATAFVTAAAVAVGCGLAGGLERIGVRGALAAATAENRALSVRMEALRERLNGLGDQVEADGRRRRAGEDDGGMGVVPDGPQASGIPSPESD